MFIFTVLLSPETIPKLSFDTLFNESKFIEILPLSTLTVLLSPIPIPVKLLEYFKLVVETNIVSLSFFIVLLSQFQIYF